MSWTQLPPISSSNIASARYEESQSILEITFKSGGAYHYYAVPADVVAFFMQAGSKGKYFIRNIKEHYRWKKV